MNAGRPVRNVPVVLGTDGANATRQRKARNQMSILEIELGMTEAEWDEFHRLQRERVFARYGIARYGIERTP